ncbi:MAG: hypothetical protein JWL79_1949 [Frankiales bacterium]|nr:hypothetical protein [Frankiales bacterium]
MLKGDLVTTPLPAVLRQLADGVVSGCLHVDDGVGGTAKVFLRGGQVYSVQVPGRRPQLGARLVSSGALGPEALAEALEAQRTELQGWRLGELLVHLGYVDQPIVESFVHEQLREQTSDLMRWPTGSWKFRVNERTREDVAPPTPVEELLESVEQRRAQWDVIAEVLHGPDAVPMLSAAGQTDAEMSIDPESWSLLCKVDGVRSVSELARECGFTLFEAGQVVYSLVRSGLLEVEEVLVGAETTTAAPAPSVDSVTSRLAMAFAPASPSEIVIPAQAEEMNPADVANLVAKALREDRTLDNRTAASDEIDASVGRVSQALSALLGDDSSASDDLFAAPKRGRNKIPKPMTLAEEAREKRQEARAKAHAKRRAADADELAQAQAELEAARAAEAEAEAATLTADHQAEIVNLAAARQAAEERAAAETAAAEAEEAARLAAEEEARATAEAEAEAARLAAEAEARLAAEAEAEAARIAAEQEAARLFAEEEARVAAEEAELARQAAEAARLFAEEEARVAAEQAAAEEAERARQAAEAEAEAARLFAEEEARVAAEQAAAEEAELARQAAEAASLFAEEEARLAAEQAAAEEAELARQAAEAARLFAEEEARLAAEQAAAEERARVEAELREAAEKQAAEDEARQIAQAAEAARIAAEFEAAEAERLAAEAEEQARSSQQRLHTADAFAELSAAAATAGDTLIAPVETVVQVEENVEDEIEEAPLRTYPPADTDMASLFRELSSLGHEDEPPAPTGPSRSPSKAAHPAAGKPKKKGLFGR